MVGRIFYKNLLRTLDPSATHAGWSDTHRFTDEAPGLCASATGYSGVFYEVIYDLGIARTAMGAAIINHNLPDLGVQTARVETGAADDGLTWGEIRMRTADMQTYLGYTPSMAGAFTSVSKRHWRFSFHSITSSTEELRIGQLCLFNARGTLPAAPTSPLQIRGDDSADIDRSIGGYETRRDVGVGSWTRRLQWEKEPGGTNVGAQVRDMLRYARKYAQWGLEPVCWVPYDAKKPYFAWDVYPCAYCVFEGIANSEVLYDGTTRRYDVNLQLRELTFDGLL